MPEVGRRGGRSTPARPQQPLEETAAAFRFETKLAAEQSGKFQVTEERELGEEVVLTNSSDDGIRVVMNPKRAATS